MLIYKIIIAATLVILLAEIAERSTPRLASILAGLPIGSGFVLLFYGLEFGSEYATNAVPYNILGLSGSLSFAVSYYIGTKVSDRYSILSGLVYGFSGFFIVAYILSHIVVSTPLIPGAILLILIALSIYLFSSIEEIQSPKKSKSSLVKILIRGLMATFFVVLVSYAPNYFSDSFSGVLSAFPSTLIPLLIVLHYSQGREFIHVIIKHLPIGYIGIMIYSISVGEFYEVYGIALGTLYSFSVSTMYLLVVGLGVSWRKQYLKRVG